MNFSLTQFLILGLATFLFVGGLTPVMRKIALKIGAVDRPNLERKTQKEPVPYLGGVGISIGITVASFGALLYSDFSTETVPTRTGCPLRWRSAMSAVTAANFPTSVL